MFITQASFQNPVQFDRRSISWRAVELLAGHPFFLVKFSSADQHRSLLLRGSDELLALHSQAELGRLTEVSLVQPTGWSAGGAPQMVPMVEMLLQAEPPDGSIPSALVRDQDGVLYGGHPVRRLSGHPGPTSVLLRLQPHGT